MPFAAPTCRYYVWIVLVEHIIVRVYPRVKLEWNSNFGCVTIVPAPVRLVALGD